MNNKLNFIIFSNPNIGLSCSIKREMPDIINEEFEELEDQIDDQLDDDQLK